MLRKKTKATSECYTPSLNADKGATEQVSVIRHRVCNHCSIDYANNRLVGRWTDLESWRVYLFNKCESRHYVPLAVWNKDNMAATNMRRIVQHWAEDLGCTVGTNVGELSKP